MRKKPKYATVLLLRMQKSRKANEGVMEGEFRHMLCERIRDLREARRLRQTELAELLGVNQRTYSRYELGEVAVSLDVIDRLADFYGTSVDFLMGRTNRMQPYPRSAAGRAEADPSGPLLTVQAVQALPEEKRRA